VFVTGRGGAGFSLARPRPYRGPGGYFEGNPRLAFARGLPPLIASTGPHLLLPIFGGNQSGVWGGRGPKRGEWQGMAKKTRGPWPLSREGRAKGRGPVFSGAPSAPSLTLNIATYSPSSSNMRNAIQADMKVGWKIPSTVLWCSKLVAPLTTVRSMRK